ncbi:MAG: hypothetical protein V1818_03685 [Candidatus Aenigmatarchaeota archaeon]
MTNLINMVCPPGTSCALMGGFGLPEILLWVLSFAIVYTATTKLNFMGKKPALLASLAISFFVLMAAPAALITAIAGMSTGFLALMTGAIVIIALFGAFRPMQLKYKANKDGKMVLDEQNDMLAQHSTAVSVVLLLAAGLIFWTYGGAQLIGITSIPSIGAVPWILVIIGAAVLWMLTGKD